MWIRTRPQPASCQQEAGRACVLAALLVAMLAAVVAGFSPAKAASVAARAEASVVNGFARLVLTFTHEVKAEVRLSSGIVIIGFDQPVDLALERLPAAMPGYVSAARRDPDGRAVRLATTRRLRVNAMPAGEKLFVDLLPDGWVGAPPGLPQDVVDDLARRAREAEAQLRRLEQVRESAGLGTVRVRAASLPTFTRFLFGVPDTVDVATHHEEDALRLVFGAPVAFDLTDARSADSDLIVSLDSAIEDETTVVRFAFTDRVDIRSFREDGAFALDVVPIGRQERGAAADVPQEGEADQPAAAPRAAAAEMPPPPAAKPEPVVAPAAAAPAPPPAPPAPVAQEPVPAVDPSAPVAARIAHVGETVRITFPFRVPTPAAAFQRADTLWLVFDTEAPLDVDALRSEAGALVRHVTVQPSGQGQVVRLRLARTPLVSTAAEGEAWVVALGNEVLSRTAPLSLTRGRSPQGDPQGAIAFVDPRRVHRLTDPDVGDRLLVVTGHAPARGFLRRQDFLEFSVLASAHGVAIAAAADDLDASLGADAVTVRRPGGLAMSPEFASPEQDDDLAAGIQAALAPAVWDADREADFAGRGRELLDAAAEAPEPRRNGLRQRLARFYLAQGMAAEAKGLLDVVLAGERDPRVQAVAQALRGFASLLLERPEAALRDLASSGYEDAQVTLLRGIALARQGRFLEARAGLETVDTDAAALPLDVQRLALHEAARCALELRDLGTAGHRLNQLRALGVPEDMNGSVHLLSGRLSEALNRPEDALVAYQAALSAAAPAAAAAADLRIVALRRALDRIGRVEAIDELERLTMSWRGGETEAEALAMLADLYAREGRYREAFGLLNVALAVHPHSRFTQRMQDETAAVFDRLFLGEGAGSLSPVEALALFYDFNKLTPSGRRGDEMIRGLAERLVAMDLLPQAAELLQYQVDNRLHGAARARSAARLATIYLMDRKPARALTVLRATRVSGLPGDLRRERLLLEARALSDSGRHDLALEIVRDIDGPEVERLRADIHWAARHWRQAAEQIEAIYGDAWRGTAPLGTFARGDILRAAVGYALAGEQLGLQRFRERYLERMPEGPDRRLFSVVTEPLGAATPEFADAARTVSATDTLTAFLRDLRAWPTTVE